MPATKEQIRQIIADNNLNSVADVYTLLRDSFKDILQELMEAELDASLGYEKNQKGNYKVREDGRILNRAAYIVLGITAEGYKDILSITVGANETSKFWLGMLNDLKNRGVQDVLFFCVDGLSGFKEAISAVYPDAQIQRCVIHMLRNSFKYVNYSDLKKFSSDFRAVYHAPNEASALSELEKIKEKWGRKYPYAVSNWENNWEDVSSFFRFSDDIRCFSVYWWCSMAYRWCRRSEIIIQT